MKFPIVITFIGDRELMKINISKRLARMIA